MTRHSASGMMLLRALARRPVDYGLDHRDAALTNVLEFAIRNPACIGDAEASAGRKIERCLEKARRGRSQAELIEHRIRRQLLKVKEALAWAELDRQLRVEKRLWDGARYALLAKNLCVLAALWRQPAPAHSGSGTVCVKYGSGPPGGALAFEAARMESVAGAFAPQRSGLARRHCRAVGSAPPDIARRQPEFHEAPAGDPRLRGSEFSKSEFPIAI